MKKPTRYTNWMRLTQNQLDNGAIALVDSGVYIIFGVSSIGKELLYIGCSTNVQKRLKNYHIKNFGVGEIRTPWGCFCDIEYAFRYDNKLFEGAMYELRLIRRLKPKGNSVIPKVWGDNGEA